MNYINDNELLWVNFAMNIAKNISISSKTFKHNIRRADMCLKYVEFSKPILMKLMNYYALAGQYDKVMKFLQITNEVNNKTVTNGILFDSKNSAKYAILHKYIKLKFDYDVLYDYKKLNVLKKPPEHQVYGILAKNGNLEILQEHEKLNFRNGEEYYIYYYAGIYKQNDILKWIKCPEFRHNFYISAFYGNINLFLKAYTCKNMGFIYTMAVVGNKLNILKWAKHVGVKFSNMDVHITPYDSVISYELALDRKLSILLNYAIIYSDLPIVKWLVKNICKNIVPDEMAVNYAAQKHRRQVVQFIRRIYDM